jgi:hypothetical protein
MPQPGDTWTDERGDAGIYVQWWSDLPETTRPGQVTSAKVVY